MTEAQLIAAFAQSAVNWGPAIFILLLLYLFSRQAAKSLSHLAGQGLDKFVGAQEKQAEALTRLAVCIEGQAEANRFLSERMTLGLRLLHEDNDKVNQRLERIEQRMM